MQTQFTAPQNGGSRRKTAALVLVLAWWLGACSATPEGPAAPDYSHLSPAQLLVVYLESLRAREAVRFRFTGAVEVEPGEVERLQGFCAYRVCGALRMQLLGPLGVTLMDYVHRDGEAELVINKLTEEGDDEARQGLLQLLDVLTRALVDTCQPADRFLLRRYDGQTAEYSLEADSGIVIALTLDRRRARLTAQTLSGNDLPNYRIDYGDYRWQDDNWLAGTLEIHSDDMPASIRLDIERWQWGTPLPDGFFATD